MIRARRNIAAMEAYVPGLQPRAARLTKLNTNENPYPPPPAVARAIRDACANLRLYPEPRSEELRRLFAKTYGVRPENVIATNGSDEILSMVFRAYVAPGDRVAYPTPTYTLYEVLCRVYDARPVPVPFDADYGLPAGILRARARLTLLANPNSPTGTFIPVGDIARLASRTRGLVLVDEAYVDFADDNALRLVRSHANVIVTRSFSKSFSLAGLRIGFGVARPEVIRELDKVRDSYNLSRPAQAGAAAALRNLRRIRATVRTVVLERERTARALRRMGLDVLPSRSNFLMAFFPDARAARAAFSALTRRQIHVRYFGAPAVARGLRITIGTRRQMDTILAALEEILNRRRKSS